MTGGPGKEHRTNKPPPTRRVQERSKGDTTCPTTSQNPSLWHPSWLNKVWTTRKDSDSEWLAKDDLETNPMILKPETASHVAAVLLGSLTLLLSAQGPLPNKISCFVSTCVSLDNSFPSVRQEPSFGPWKGSPFLQQHWRLLRSSGQGCFRTYGDQWSYAELYLIWFSQYFSVLWFSVIILIVCCDLRNWFSDPVRRDDW